MYFSPAGDAVKATAKKVCDTQRKGEQMSECACVIPDAETARGPASDFIARQNVNTLDESFLV